MAERPSHRDRLLALARRVAAAPGAGRRRHTELVRRDDVEHHLLVSLHERVAELSELVRGLERRLDGLTGVQAELVTATERARATADAARAAAESARDRAADAETGIARLALVHADRDAPSITEGPLVSIIMPTWRRAGWILDAIRSVQAQSYRSWELWVVDDGSDDGTDEVVAPLLADDRIRYLAIGHQGVSAARNAGLAAARGEIVTYLDTDNTWRPSHLARHVQALLDDPDAQWSITGQLIRDGRTGRAELRKDLRTIETLVDGNFVDMNVLAHRRSALDRVGRFDPDLTRLGDWDLALRLSRLGPPARSDAVTVVYRLDAPDRLTATTPVHHATHVVRARHRGLPAEGLRLLFAEWHYPQITESYISTLARGFARLGAEVEVWSQTDPSVPDASPFPVHRGALTDALASFSPDVVLTHWLLKGLEFRRVTGAAGVAHVVRTHGFDADPDHARLLLEDEGVVVTTFPHLVQPEWVGHPRLSVQVTCFDEDRFAPGEKDRALVVRTAAGLRTKDLEAFLLAASACPDNRFVLVLGHALHAEHITEEMTARAEELGSPCEILVDVPNEQVADLLGRAAIYVHTHGVDQTFGMPISIAEALGSGCYTIVRDLPGAGDYVGNAGARYAGDTVEERAGAISRLVQATGEWSDERWRSVAERSVDQAYSRHASRDVAERMLTDWVRQVPAVARATRRRPG